MAVFPEKSLATVRGLDRGNHCLFRGKLVQDANLHACTPREKSTLCEQNWSLALAAACTLIILGGHGQRRRLPSERRRHSQHTHEQ